MKEFALSSFFFMSWFTVYLNQTKRLASTKQGPIELSLEQIEKVSRSREPLAEDPSLSL
ncbi:hypothetical protein LguiA_036071 [Lonicera macranthoides]